MTDEQITIEVINGNKELYEELVKRYQEKLLRYVKYLVKNDNSAFDIVQDTFIKAFENLNSFNSSLKFSSWIYRIAHNESVNRIKKTNRELFNVDFDFLGDVLPQDSSPEIEFERDEIANELKKRMELLPVKFREVLTLYYLENKSYEEISDILRVSVGTVGTWINRGKIRLKKLFEEMNKKYY